MTEAKGRTVCFGTNYRQAPEVLHGYDQSLKGKKNLTGAECVRVVSQRPRFCATGRGLAWRALF